MHTDNNDDDDGRPRPNVVLLHVLTDIYISQ